LKIKGGGRHHLEIFENPTWRTGAILKIENLLQNFMQVQNDAFHKFGIKRQILLLKTALYP